MLLCTIFTVVLGWALWRIWVYEKSQQQVIKVGPMSYEIVTPPEQPALVLFGQQMCNLDEGEPLTALALYSLDGMSVTEAGKVSIFNLDAGDCDTIRFSGLVFPIESCTPLVLHGIITPQGPALGRNETYRQKVDPCPNTSRKETGTPLVGNVV